MPVIPQTCPTCGKTVETLYSNHSDITGIYGHRGLYNCCKHCGPELVRGKDLGQALHDLNETRKQAKEGNAT